MYPVTKFRKYAQIKKNIVHLDPTKFQVSLTFQSAFLGFPTSRYAVFF